MFFIILLLRTVGLDNNKSSKVLSATFYIASKVYFFKPMSHVS